MEKSSSKVESPTTDEFSQLFKRLINLRADTNTSGTIEFIKSNVDFQSANAWTLVFAIFIASVGLNINSTAVVIGAMLISPLMGPIVGIGLALGTYDFVLLKKSARNLFAAILISVVTSMIYFLLSPLSEVKSEILARIRPSFFDVLIAFFGGAAGIVAISRKQKGNVISGVAIATALMPPLCTAGFGLATRNFTYFVGAMYLFIINSVFISISTFIFVRYLGFHKVGHVDAKQRSRINRWISYVGIIVLIPSFFMAWYLQKESFFIAQASKYIAQEFRSDKFFVVDKEISYNLKKAKIRIVLLGEPVSEKQLASLAEKASSYSISPESVEIHQSSFSENLERKISEKLSSTEDLSKQLEVKLSLNESELSDFKRLMVLSDQVTTETQIVFPKIAHIYINKLPPETISQDSNKTGRLHVLVQWKTVPGKSEINKSINFLQKRLDIDGKSITNVREL
jgi:uncharacterized hydrophobic protein (TIGR00271 family)